jgi:hypothetical protein
MDRMLALTSDAHNMSQLKCHPVCTLVEVVTIYKSFTSANGGTLGPGGCYEVRVVLMLYIYKVYVYYAIYIYGNRPGQQLLNHPLPLLCSLAQTAVVYSQVKPIQSMVML